MIARNRLPLLATALLLPGVAVGQYPQQYPQQDAWGARNVPAAVGQTYPVGNPSSAIRPIDAPSIVDRYRPRGFQTAPQPATQPQQVNVASAQIGQYPAQQQYPTQPFPAPAQTYPVQRTAFQVPTDQQPLAQPSLQAGQYQVPGNQFNNQNLQQPIAPGIAPPPQFPQQNVQPLQPTYPQTLYPQPQAAAQGFASVGNTPCVSPPSTWTASGAWGGSNIAQTSAVSPQVYVPPQTSVPPVLTPDLAPNAYAPNNAGYRPLVALGSPYPNVQVGRGIIGQPTVYVPNQPIRNFFRYLSP